MHQLFPPLSPEARRILSQLPEALQAVQPLTSTHRRQLPLAIEELSTRLTSERGVAALPYWSAPRFTSAYLWYFLPWNMLRLTRLLATLDIPAPTPLPLRKGEEAQPRVLVDMGSGPLSLPLALWLAKPQWRDMPLTLLCMDVAPHPLELGSKLLSELAGPDSPWRVITARAPVDALARELSKVRGVPWLITGANVLNELKARPRTQEEGVSERLEALVEQLSAIMEAVPSDDVRALLVEPGTRLGGKTMLTLREAALETGLTPCSPCPHVAECPLEDSRTWCHFTFDVEGAPAWLRELSEAARLRKDALSLSFLMLRAQQEGEDENTATSTDAQAATTPCGRIISAPFMVPAVAGYARYACTEQGLALVSKAGGLPSGALVALRPTQSGRRDAKSGALIMDHAEATPDSPPTGLGEGAGQGPRPAGRPGGRTSGRGTGLGATRGEGAPGKARANAEDKRPSADKSPKDKNSKDRKPKDKKPIKSKKQPAPKFWEK